MNNPQYSNERTIRIRDLFISVCQRWRSLIVCLVIGAIVLGAYGWLKSVDDAIYTQEQAEAIALSLGSKRAGVIESYAEDIKDSTEQMIRQGKYNKEALLMKQDPFHLHVYEIKFFIGNEEGNESDITKNSALVQAYVSKLQDGFLGQKIKAVFEEKEVEKHREFYESPVLVKVDETNQSAGILSFLLYLEDDNTDVVIQLKEKMQAAKWNVEAELGIHTLSLIGESNYDYADMDILRIQEANSQRINDLTERIEKIRKQITDTEELKYLNYLIYKSDSAMSENGIVEKASHHINKKYIALGAALGLFLAVIVIIIKYISSNTIKNPKEIEEDFGIPLLGEIEGGHSFYQKRRTRLDKWLRNKKNRIREVLTEKETVDLIATRIRIEAKKRNLQKLGLVIDKGVDKGAIIPESIAACLEQDAQIQIIRDVFEQTESIKELADVDGVVLVEQVDSSRYDDFRKVAALCRNYQVQVLGSIVAE